ncbi:hypothetical protein [Asticcacaulis solisilvae]|uniref:hypothetical protein n=1 Tax=Asticcacaulis solisilvae TaxID=1217274 RepID=UPI003FD76D13
MDETSPSRRAIKAETIDSFEGAVAAENGEHIVLKLFIGGEQAFFALPRESALTVAQALMTSETRARVLQNPDNVSVPAVRVGGYGMAVSDTGLPVLTLESAPGVQMAYVMEPETARDMVRDLQHVLTLIATEGQTRQ